MHTQNPTKLLVLHFGQVFRSPLYFCVVALELALYSSNYADAVLKPCMLTNNFFISSSSSQA